MAKRVLVADALSEEGIALLDKATGLTVDVRPQITPNNSGPSFPATMH